MTTLKLNMKGDDVKTLQRFLSSLNYTCSIDGSFGPKTEQAVKDFQSDNGLTADGIVGSKTWKIIIEMSGNLTEQDYKEAAAKIGCSVAAIKAVQSVETGGRAAFNSDGKPTILFEGHIFWQQLKKQGINPEKYVTGNSDILYKSWTKKYYKSGSAEYDRLNRAIKINETAALSSASWGMFQIMGFNYATCGCSSVNDYVNKTCSSAKNQLNMFVTFLVSNKWHTYLKNLDWAGFANKYNGPSYKENAYDTKLAAAYKKFL
jgi:hypothetical protein